MADHTSGGEVAALAEAVRALSARLSEVEDRLAITQLLATYGPAVDSGDAETAGGLWSTDGVYDSGVATFEGAAGVAAMVGGEMHQGIIAGGSAHLVGAPRIEVRGDRAVATCYSQLVRHDAERDAFYIWRTTANRWELAREAGGWRVTNRLNRLLDGGADARALLGAAADAAAPPIGEGR